MIIHLDTEFTDFVNIDLISIGLVAENGKEFYGENLDFKKEYSSDWVKENVYPLLDTENCGYRRIDLSVSLWEWLNSFSERVTILCDYSTDLDLLVDLFNYDDHPNIKKLGNFYHLIGNLIENGKFNKAEASLGNYFNEYISNNNLTIHHSLSDAKANQYAFNKVVKQFNLKVEDYV